MSLIKWRNSKLFPGSSDWTENFLNRDVDDYFSNWCKGLTVPAVNVTETGSAYELEMAAPGMKKSDFKIEVNRGVLTISAENESSSEKTTNKYTHKEFSFNTFRRSFWLPDSVIADGINAAYEDGLLKICLPKNSPPREAATEIKIS